MNRIFPILVTLFCVALAFPSLGQTVFFVSQDGIGNGLSWSSPLGSLNEALSQVQEGDQVWVSEGEYFPINCTNCSIEDQKVAFAIPKGVFIFGGFNGDEMSIGDRNIEAHPTILNGNIGNSFSHSDNSYSVITLEYPDQRNVIDGFIVKNGNADGIGDSLGPERSGGAIHVKGNGTGNQSQLEIKNCKFFNNRAESNGGAIKLYAGFGGSIICNIQDCVFEGNGADEKGGAIYFYAAFDGSISGELNGVHFEQNRAHEGGAINIISANQGVANLNFTSSSFTFNEATNKGGALATFTSSGETITNFQSCYFSKNDSDQGGAIFLDGTGQGKSNGTYTNCNFEANTGKNGGGAIFNNGTGGESNNNYFQCLFKSNYCFQSGAAFFNSGSNQGECLTNYDKCRFVENVTAMYGAGMYNFGKNGLSSPTITNCLFIGNESDSGTSIYSYGGQNGLSEPKVINTTFTKNIARVGPCIYNQASDITGTVRPFVSNCIFWENIATSGFGLVFQNGHAEPTIQYSLIPFDDCELLNTQPNSTLTCGPGIIFNDNPLFINPDQNDFRLAENSPAIDMGIAYSQFIDNFDLDGADRLLNSIIDFGPFEQNSTTTLEIVQQPLDGTYCEGAEVLLNIELLGGEAQTYEWFNNGLALPNSNSATLLLSEVQLEDGGTYYCVVNDINGTLQSSVATVEVKGTSLPSITLSTTQEQYCQGDNEKTVEAIFEDAGYFYELSWYLNGVALNVDGTALTTNVNDQDELSATLTSSAICLDTDNTVSDTLIFEELAELEASVLIQSDQSSFCSGEPIEVEAIPTNGGNQSQYEWILNGIPLSVSTSLITLQNVENNDVLKVIMTSSLDCVQDQIVESSELVFEILPLVNPTVEIVYSMDSFCLDSIQSLSLLTQFPGDNPEFNWFLNGELQVNHSQIWQTSFNQLGINTLSAEMISSEDCPESSSVFSQTFNFAVLNCTTSSQSLVNTPSILVYPNPSNGWIQIEGDNIFNSSSTSLEIFDRLGALVYSKNGFKSAQIFDQIDLNSLSQGAYFLRISNVEFTFSQRLIILK